MAKSTGRHIRVVWAVFTYCFCLAVPNAFGLGDVIAGGGNAQPGGTSSLSADTAGDFFDGVLQFYVQLDANRSYACTALARQNLDQISIDPAVQDSDGAIDAVANNVVQRGDVTPAVTGNMSPASITDDRISITPATSEWYLFIVRNASTTTAVDVRFECMETSLYGGYNTNANPFNFLELTNTTNATINGRVRGYNYDGTPTVNTTFSLPANRRFDLDVHGAAGANKYGLLVVTHDGPYGALQGAVSQYNGPVSALSLSATVPLKPREQTF